MLLCKNNRLTNRTQKGNALVEIGPALLIAFFFLFFPLLNLSAMGMTFAACVSLNYAQLREAAFSTTARAQHPEGSVRKGIPERWSKSGVGQFVSTPQLPVTSVTYRHVEGLKNDLVTVSTMVTVKPAFTLPFFSSVPGLGAPITYTISNERLVENVAAAG
jgi:hypothetical protein